MRRGVFVLLCMLSVAKSAWAGPQIGVTVDAQLRVSINASGGRKILATSEPVFRNDRLIANSTGLAQIKLIDDTKLVVGPNSNLVLDKFVFSGESTAKAVSVVLTKGAFRFISGHSGSKAYSIVTPAGSVGVRGTAFDVTILGNTTNVVLLRGQVNVCPRNGRCRMVRTACAYVTFNRNGFLHQGKAGALADSGRRLFPLLGRSQEVLPSFRGNSSGCGSSATPPKGQSDPAALARPEAPQPPPPAPPPPTPAPPLPEHHHPHHHEHHHSRDRDDHHRSRDHHHHHSHDRGNFRGTRGAGYNGRDLNGHGNGHGGRNGSGNGGQRGPRPRWRRGRRSRRWQGRRARWWRGRRARWPRGPRPRWRRGDREPVRRKVSLPIPPRWRLVGPRTRSRKGGLPFARAARTRSDGDRDTRPRSACGAGSRPSREERVLIVPEYLDEIAEAFADVIDSKSPFTSGHSKRVAVFTDLVAEELRLEKDHRRWLKRAAPLHDIGKLGVSNSILESQGNPPRRNGRPSGATRC